MSQILLKHNYDYKTDKEIVKKLTEALRILNWKYHDAEKHHCYFNLHYHWVGDQPSVNIAINFESSIESSNEYAQQIVKPIILQEQDFIRWRNAN